MKSSVPFSRVIILCTYPVMDKIHYITDLVLIQGARQDWGCFLISCYLIHPLKQSLLFPVDQLRFVAEILTRENLISHDAIQKVIKEQHNPVSAIKPIVVYWIGQCCLSSLGIQNLHWVVWPQIALLHGLHIYFLCFNSKGRMEEGVTKLWFKKKKTPASVLA